MMCAPLARPPPLPLPTAGNDLDMQTGADQGRPSLSPQRSSEQAHKQEWKEDYDDGKVATVVTGKGNRQPPSDGHQGSPPLAVGLSWACVPFLTPQGLLMVPSSLWNGTEATKGSRQTPLLRGGTWPRPRSSAEEGRKPRARSQAGCRGRGAWLC